MKRKIIIILTIFSLSLLVAKSAPTPDWFSNYRNTFLNSEYLAQRGSGSTAESAKTDAAAQLARYFQTTVNSNLSTTMSSISTDSALQEETRVLDEVNVTSEVEFIGLEFTESYYYKPEKKWYAVAYIVRDDAWIQYKPKIEAEKTKFYALVKKAESEEDSYTKISLYKTAKKVAGDFLEKLEYGRIINPKEEDKYSADRTEISELYAKIENERKNLTVRVNINGDYGNIIETAIKKAFEKGGFIIGSNGNYEADVNISSNSNGDNPLTIMPAVSVNIKNRVGKSVFSYETKLMEKTVAYLLENAQKKAFPKLAEKINQEINF